MLRSQYRLTGHAVAAVLLAGVAVVATGAGAGAASSAASRPDSYGGNSAAASIEFRVDKQPFNFPVTDPFHAWVPYAGTSIDSSGNAEAIASSIYPGQGVLGVPALICEFAAQLCQAFPGGALPDYPDWAHAQYPSNPDASAQLSQKPFPGTGPFEVTPNEVVAHADPSRTEATTVTDGGGVTGVVSVQSATSHSLQQFQGSTLLLTAESVLKGIDIGGQLHIDEVRSTTTAKIDGAKIGVATADTTVSGATVAGQGVTIDSTGVHAAGQGDSGLLKKTVNSALQKLAGKGIQVRSLGITRVARPRKVAAETGGLLVIAKQSVNGPSLPKVGGAENGNYTITATLGGAGVNAFATPAVPLGNVSLPSTPPTVSASNPAPPSSGGSVPPPSNQTATTSNGQQPALASGSAPKNAALPIDLTNKRLKTLALVLLGYPLLVLIGAPLRAPSRLPRGG
jgi:hypothetical protein